jgi:hypothetical protein
MMEGRTLSSLLKGNLEVINVLKTVKAYQAFLGNELLGG